MSLHTGLIKPGSSEIENYQVDHNVICTNEILKLIKGIKETPQITTLDNRSIPYMFLPNPEDLNHQERQNLFLRHSVQNITTKWTPEYKTEFVTSNFNKSTSKLDGYTDDQAEEQYLSSKPMSFLIVSKPNIGEIELAKMLAETYKLVLLTPESLILDEITSDSNVGKCINVNLKNGRAIGADIFLRLLEKRIKTQSVQHRGCVIAGFPLIPNRNFKEEPLSTESAIFTVQEIFEDIIYNVRPDSASTMKGSKVSVEEEAVHEEIEVKTKKKNINLPERDIGSENNMSSSHAYFSSIENQIKFVFDILIQPYVLIYIFCENLDVANKISTYRFNLITEHEISIENGSTVLFPDFLNLYETEREFVDYKHNFKLPVHFDSSISAQLVEYKYKILSIINETVLNHDPQYFIKIDGRLKPHKMFDSLNPRLRCLGIQPALIPEIISKEIEGEDFEEENFKNTDLEDAFAQLRTRNITNQMFKWQLSHWKFKCPVATKYGEKIDGLAENAVRFMNKIYFLSDEQAITSFYRNPRPFLIPCQPMPVYNIIVIGPKLSGKTVMSKCLSYIFNLTYLNAKNIKTKYKQCKENEHLEKIRRTALLDGLKLLEETREKEMEEKIKLWLKSTLALLKNEFPDIAQASYSKIEQLEISKDYISSMSVASFLSDQTKVELNNELQLLLIPVNDPEKIQKYFEEPETLLHFLPDDLKKTISPTVRDQFVIDYVDNAINEAEVIIELTPEEMYNTLLEAIASAENYNTDKNGWVIDDFPIDMEFLECFKNDEIANEVIFLNDKSDGNIFLKTKFKENNFNENRVIRNFLKEKFYKYENSEIDSMFKIVSASSKVFDKQLTMEDYEQHLQEFLKDINEILKVFQNSCPNTLIEKNLSEQTMSDILTDVIVTLTSRYKKIASILSEAEKTEELDDFGEPKLDEEYEEEDLSNDQFQENRRLGDTSIYCPIAFHKYFALWKGKEQFACKFQEKIYLLSNQQAMVEFLTNSYNYILANPPDKIPPMRILIIGAIGTGKSTYGKILADHFGLFYFNFVENLLEFLCLDTNKNLEEYLNDTEPNEVAILHNYLKGDGLPPYILKSIIQPLWTSNPYKETGIVIDNFPKKLSDAEYLIEHYFIPDVVIELVSTQGQILERTVKIRMDKWAEETGEKKKIFNEEFNRKIDEWNLQYDLRVDKFFSAMTEERRHQFLTSISPKPPQSSPIDSSTNIIEEVGENEYDIFVYDPVQRDEDLDMIKKQVLIDFPKPIITQSKITWKTYEEAAEEIENFINTTYYDEIKEINDIRTLITDENIDYLTLENDKTIDKLKMRMFKILEKYKFRNRSLFERVYSIDINTAEKLLEQGYYFLSKFNKTCPVQVYEKTNPLQMYLQSEQKQTLFPVIYRKYIYFICEEKNFNKFKTDPLKYVENIDYQLPLLPFKMAIIGPKCGKTYLAEKIQKELGLKMITRGQACRNIMKNLKFCELAKIMDRVLRKGWSITEDMMASAVQAATFDGEAIALGYILVGCPNSVREMKCLEDLDIIPNIIVEINISLSRIKEIVSDEVIKDKLAIYSYEFIKHRYDAYMSESKHLKDYLFDKYQNIIELKFTSKWKQWEDSKHIIFKHLFDIEYYFNNKNLTIVLPLKYLLITPSEFEEKQSEYLHYCPCCSIYNRYLVSGGSPPNRNGLVQFKQYYYWICDEHYNEFINNAPSFLPPYQNVSLPEQLPMRTKQICYDYHENGVCIVTFWDNQPKNILIDGSSEFKVTYRNKCYIFCSEECMNKFLKEPLKYYDVKIHFRDTKPLCLEQLSTLGYLEQHVANLLCEVILETEKVRPVHPCMNVEKSAILYMALLLKCRNPKMKFLEQCQEFKRKFDERREIIMKYLKMAKMVFPSDKIGEQ